MRRIRQTQNLGRLRLHTREALRLDSNGVVIYTDTVLNGQKMDPEAPDQFVGNALKMYFFKIDSFVYVGNMDRDTENWSYDVLPSTTKLIGKFPKNDAWEILTLGECLIKAKLEAEPCTLRLKSDGSGRYCFKRLKTDAEMQAEKLEAERKLEAAKLHAGNVE
jgi:hypothetical protein